jgi:hypothetical protein
LITDIFNALVLAAREKKKKAQILDCLSGIEKEGLLMNHLVFICLNRKEEKITKKRRRPSRRRWCTTHHTLKISHSFLYFKHNAELEQIAIFEILLNDHILNSREDKGHVILHATKRKQ